MPDLDPLTLQLASYRSALEIPQATAARAIGVARKTLWAWERGKSVMPLPMAVRYAELVGARLALLVDEDGCE